MIVVSIAGVDRTRLIDYDSLKIVEVLTNQPNTAQFIIKKFGSRTYVPAVNEEIIITQDGTKVFAGHILEVEEAYDTADYVAYIVRCVDYTRAMDGQLIVNSYENMTVAAIIASIRSNYLPGGITINNAQGVTTLIKYIAFNYETPSDALRQLAEISDSDWYIDYDKDIHFFQRGAIEADYNLTDTNGNYIYDSLILRKDLSQLRNVIYVRGGEYLGNTITAASIADGTEANFFLPHKFSNLTLTVTGARKSVGVDPIDDPNLYDALHNFQEKVVKFRADRKPSINSEVRIGGNPHLPVITKMRDIASVALYTAREHLVIDKSIRSKEGARQRALAELLTYSQTITEGEFSTYVPGLVSGSVINVQSTLRNIDEDYVISKIEARVFATDASDGSLKLKYRVHLISTKTFDYISLLQKLLRDKKKEVVIDPNDVLDEVEQLDESAVLSETLTGSLVHNPIAEAMALSETLTAGFHSGTQFVLTPWTSGQEEGIKRAFILNGSPLA